MQLSVLMVEDEPIDRLLARAALGPLNANIAEAGSIAEAEAILQRKSFDCLILDWHLPDGSADDLLQSVRDQHPHLPIVVLTGSDDVRLAEVVLKEGAQDYLVKDELGDNDLARSVRYAVERQRALRLQAQLTHADRLASMGQLAAGIAHEINNPALVLTTNLELVLTAMQGVDEMQDLAPLIRECIVSTNRISSLTRQLASFSRRGPRPAVTTDLPELVKEGIRLAQPSAKHWAEIRFDADEVPPVAMDRSAFMGVIVNLLVNAQQALDRVERADHVIRVTVRRLGDAALVTVEDSGPGIPVAQRPHVFEAFTSGRAEGTGLGLTICRDVVQAHGGTIELRESELGGPAFVIRFPLDTGLVPTVPAPRSRELPRLRILVLDDEPLVLTSLRRILHAHEVVAATSLAAAFAALANGFEPEVILCDLMLGDESGADFHYRVAADPSSGLAERIVFVTGGAVTPRATEFLRTVDPPVLHKPFGRTQLVDAIWGILEQ